MALLKSYLAFPSTGCAFQFTFLGSEGESKNSTKKKGTVFILVAKYGTASRENKPIELKFSEWPKFIIRVF